MTGPPDGPVPSGFVPISVTFVSADHGWVLGDAPCGTPNCTSLLRTRDGGKTWHGIPAPVAASTVVSPNRNGRAPVQVTSVRFADENNGWVFGPQLWATHDGGAHWNQELALPGDQSAEVRELEAASGWATALVGHGCGDYAYCSSYQLAAAPLGAGAWRAVGDTLAKASNGSASATLAVHGSRRFLIAGGTFYSGPNDNTVPTPLGQPCVGRIPGSTTSPPEPGALAAADEQHLDLGCFDGAHMGRADTVELGTTDGGNTWKTTSAVKEQPDVSTAADNGRGVLLVASNSVVDTLLRSTDDGNTYTTVLRADSNGEGDAPLEDLGFTTPDQGVTVAYGHALYMTHDAGRTWQPVNFG